MHHGGSQGGRTEAVGNLHVCARQLAGVEEAIHAMREIFDRDECEAIILVDAKNAFNTINRKTMFHKISGNLCI